MTRYFQTLLPLQQLRLLLAGSILLLLLAFVFAFRPTLQLYTQYQANNTTLSVAAQAPLQIQTYQTRLAELQQEMQHTGYDRAALFATVNTFCQEAGLSLTNFAPEIRKQVQEQTLVTNQIEVEGNFTAILQLTYQLEQTWKLGHIASTQYKRKKDVRTKKTQLHATIYLQHVL